MDFGLGECFDLHFVCHVHPSPVDLRLAEAFYSQSPESSNFCRFFLFLPTSCPTLFLFRTFLLRWRIHECSTYNQCVHVQCSQLCIDIALNFAVLVVLRLITHSLVELVPLVELFLCHAIHPRVVSTACKIFTSRSVSARVPFSMVSCSLISKVCAC